MPYSITISNTTQSSFVPLSVIAVPAANPEDLIWTSGGTGITQAGVNGTIFANIPQDQVSPPDWYHGGNPPVPVNAVELHSCQSLAISNSQPEVISSQMSKGLFELRTSATPNPIQNILAATNATIVTLNNHNFIVGDKVEITGTGMTILTSGVYKVMSIINSTSFTIDGDSSSGGAVGTTTTVNLHNYLWDEVYTTPVGLYNALPYSVTNPDIYEFRMGTSNSSDELVIYVGDPNIIPKVNDSIVLQRFFQTENTFVNGSTTDGINSVLNYSDSETYEFKILAVSSLPNPLGNVTPYVEYTLTLDKSFAPIIDLGTPEQYMVVLLNRMGTTVDRELFTDTWKLTQVYRGQLLGDPYNFAGVTQPVGRKNYLYYKGAELLGVKSLLDGIITPGETPFVILDFADEIKDRIYSGVGEVEVHLPTIMIQGERTPTILTNSQGSVLTDTSGAGTYEALYLKYPNSALVRYGWVFYDLRIVVIDHAELATAMGYNANRNYTLPTPILPTVGNSVARSTIANPILITGASNTTTIIITTLTNHNLATGDEVIISGVLGNTNANTSSLITPYYVNVLTPVTFEIYLDSGLTTPIAGNAAYVSGGLMYGRRLPFEYFYTYRIKGVHYNTLPYAELIPFNWQLNGGPDETTSATLDTQFDSLTHLVDSVVLEGFAADEYEIIIGKYVQSLVDPYTINGVEDVVVMDAISLLSTGTQISPVHTTTFTRNDYNTVVGAAVFPDYTDPLDTTPNNPAYNIFNVSSQLIYNLYANSLPQTLFTSEGEWTVGLIKYKSQAQQYRIVFEVTVPASKWNATQNPTFDVGNLLMNEKLITEVEFLIKDITGTTVDVPYVYAKISPPIKKNNLSDLILRMELDF